MRAFTFMRATIPSGAALSQGLNLGSWRVAGLVMPAAWTAADLTFEAGVLPDGATFDLYDDAGAEVALTVAPGRYVALTGAAREALDAVRWARLRSGTAGAPVNQAADREVIVVLEEEA